MKPSFIPTLSVIFCWVAWALLPKFSAQWINPKSAIVYQGLGVTILSLLILINLGNSLESHPKALF